jgi:hypothetical protein
MREEKVIAYFKFLSLYSHVPRRTRKNLSVPAATDEIRAENFLNTSQIRYLCANLMDVKPRRKVSFY